MYFIMYKLYEDEILVKYKIETRIYTNIFINEKGKPDSQLKTIYAYCTFNKKTEEFNLDKILTDPYFLKDSREIIKARLQLIKRVRENNFFDDIIEIATG